jgi:uncharacterized repeat protein (TIGR04138 family)
MQKEDLLLPVLEAIAEKSGRYKSEGYLFLLSALHFTQGRLSAPRHISGPELLDGVRLYALKRFGPMTRTVFEHWGIYETVDFGHMVFDLVKKKILSKTEEDSIDDFSNLYDFKKAFDQGWIESLDIPITSQSLK